MKKLWMLTITILLASFVFSACSFKLGETPTVQSNAGKSVETNRKLKEKPESVKAINSDADEEIGSDESEEIGSDASEETVTNDDYGDLIVTENDGNNDDEDTDDNLKRKVCKKYQACGCQDYKKCMKDAEEGNFSDEVLECLLKSSCKSLCAGKPDGCTGAGNNPRTNMPKRSACPQLKCSKNSDCPIDCYGGCNNGHCLLF